MSATGRGEKRAENDFYETPAWLSEAFLWALRNKRYHVTEALEPACGNGAISRVVWEVFGLRRLKQIDIRDQTIVGEFQKANFLHLIPDPSFDLVITNPPYSLAQEFCERAMLWRRSRHSVVAMLLRLNFLESQKRASWLRQNTPSIYVSPRRPSFTGKGTDATGYAWFIWDGEKPTVEILETEK